MPTVIIRPDAISSDSGFDQTGSNLLSRINDKDCLFEFGSNFIQFENFIWFVVKSHYY